ncbi:MAG TPA: hypothetical protein VN577_08175 [Terriglobales bacterium]|nr:hypothetical protein [Terriglobales bacterium]
MNNAPKHLILLVDDEAAVRENIALLLRATGYDVSTAADGLGCHFATQQGDTGYRDL